MEHPLTKINLLGVGITNATEDESLEYLVENLRKSTKKLFIITPNPEILVIADKDPEYKKVLNSADLALADGVGITLGARLLGKGLKQRITGVDFVENVSRLIAKEPITVGFIGGQPGVADIAAECLKDRYPGLKVTFSSSDLVLDKKISCDMLFVALGAPRQEEWIYQNLPKLSVKAAMGVGGALDYISGRVPRAPLVFRKLGLEWLFRLIVQPWRLKRQLKLLTFAKLLILDRNS